MRFERRAPATRFASPNVVALLPGTDPALADEYVLLMAHLDHSASTSAGRGDRINNGAMDNATGDRHPDRGRTGMAAGATARAARSCSPRSRPRRRACSAPNISPAIRWSTAGMVSVVNLDMPILTYDFQDVIAFGAEHSTLGPIVARAAARMAWRSPRSAARRKACSPARTITLRPPGRAFGFLMTGFAGGGQRTDFLENRYHSPATVDLPFNWQAGAPSSRSSII